MVVLVSSGSDAGARIAVAEYDVMRTVMVLWRTNGRFQLRGVGVGFGCDGGNGDEEEKVDEEE